MLCKALSRAPSSLSRELGASAKVVRLPDVGDHQLVIAVPYGRTPEVIGGAVEDGALHCCAVPYAPSSEILVVVSNRVSHPGIPQYPSIYLDEVDVAYMPHITVSSQMLFENAALVIATLHDGYIDGRSSARTLESITALPEVVGTIINEIVGRLEGEEYDLTPEYVRQERLHQEAERRLSRYGDVSLTTYREIMKDLGGNALDAAAIIYSYRHFDAGVAGPPETVTDAMKRMANRRCGEWILDQILEVARGLKFPISREAYLDAWDLLRQRLGWRSTWPDHMCLDLYEFDPWNPGMPVDAMKSRGFRSLEIMRAKSILAEEKARDAQCSPPRKTGQLWESCPKCGNEPVYMPLMLCESCWPK